jgi:class 3 adenylate cyclase
MLCAIWELRQWLSDPKRTLGHALSMQVGVHSGHVIAAYLGSRRHGRQVTLVGRNLEVTRQVLQAAPAGEVYISSTTWDLVARILESKPVGTLPAVAGVSGGEPVGLFHVLGVKSAGCGSRKER